MVVLEALNALYGDCLILRYKDSSGKERRWLIDGGPKSNTVNGKPLSVWKDVLLPRLKQINAVEPFIFDLGMVSHIDDDHINGMERLTAELVAALPGPGSVKFNKFWLNSFDEIVGPTPAGLGKSSGELAHELASQPAGPVAAAELEEDGAAVALSVPQGNKLAASLRSLGLDGNTPFNKLISVAKGQGAQRPDDASVTIVGPLQKRLDRLRKDWQKALAKPSKKAKTAALQELFATKLDSSVPNLSSIVVLVEIDGKRMLLTGDARGDDIVTAWKELGLPDASRKIDLLKMPHHGSVVNSPKNFLEFFTAKHYVFSADGHNDNPDPPLLEGLVSLHGKRPIALHFTNADVTWSKAYKLEKDGAKVKTLKEMLAALKTAYPGPWTSKARASNELALTIEL